MTESVRIGTIFFGLLRDYGVDVFVSVLAALMYFGGLISVTLPGSILILSDFGIAKDVSRGGIIEIAVTFSLRGGGASESAHARRRVYERAGRHIRGIRFLGGIFTGCFFHHAARRSAVQRGGSNSSVLVRIVGRVLGRNGIDLTLQDGFTVLVRALILRRIRVNEPIYEVEEVNGLGARLRISRMIVLRNVAIRSIGITV